VTRLLFNVEKSIPVLFGLKILLGLAGQRDPAGKKIDIKGTLSPD
jgi:hypothetical protein